MDRGGDEAGIPSGVNVHWERLGALEARLGCLESMGGELAGEIDRVARIIRGNGEDGLFGKVRLAEEGLEAVRRQLRWLLWFQGTLVAALVAALVAGCGLARDPSAREAHELVRPDGTRVLCHEPPPDVVPAAVRAEVEARIPDVIEVVNARLGVAEAFERIRAGCPTLQAVEALEFRMCVAWAQGVVGDGAYAAFLGEILPLLREACGGEASREGDGSEGNGGERSPCSLPPAGSK